LGLGDSKLGFWDEEWDFRDSQLSVLATASKLARGASNVVTASHVCPPRRAELLATASIGVTESHACPPWRVELLATASIMVIGGMSRPPWRASHLGGELPQFQFFFFTFCVLFTRFCFELAFGINMKVSENFISFSKALSRFENTLWILIYDENSPSESW